LECYDHDATSADDLLGVINLDHKAYAALTATPVWLVLCVCACVRACVNVWRPDGCVAPLCMGVDVLWSADDLLGVINFDHNAFAALTATPVWLVVCVRGCVSVCGYVVQWCVHVCVCVSMCGYALLCECVAP
jgi:hypothetical protein